MGKENINIKYEHQNNSNYLVIEDNVEYDDYQYKMLRRNKPEHFLRFSMYSVNGRYGIYYDITSRQQLSKYYEYGKMTMEDVKSICVNISEMVRIAEDYMLDIDHVKIEPRFIYMDVGTKKLQFVYHTKVNGYSFNESLKILFEFILEHFDHSLDKESIVQLYEVYQKVIVGDYDPFNLMRMFGIKKVKKQEESVIQDMPEKRDKEIKTVIAEQMISDKEEKADESDVNIRKVIIGVVSMAFGLLGIFVPGLIPFRIPSVLSFICVGAGIGILVFCKKEHKKLQSVILTQKQSIPYVVKKDTAQVLYNESVNVNRIAVVIGHAPSLRLDRPSVVDIPLRLHCRILDAFAHHLDHRRLGSVEHLVGAHAETVVQSGVTPLVHRRPLFRWHAVACLAENRALFPVAQRRSSLETVYTEARARRASGSSSDRACGRRLRLREAGAAPARPSGRGPSRRCVRGTCGRSRHDR